MPQSTHTSSAPPSASSLDVLGIESATALDVDEASVSSGSESDASSLASYVAPIENSVTMKRAKRNNAGANLKTEIARYKGEEKRDNADGDGEDLDWGADYLAKEQLGRGGRGKGRWRR